MKKGMRVKMPSKIGISGAPGTGKTSVARALASLLKYELIEINELADKHGFYEGYDDARGCYILDMEKVCNYINHMNKNIVVEGHTAHLCKLDVVIILRCDPEILAKRLRERGWSDEKIRENVEAEILDIITQEAVRVNETVYEIDTTHKRAQEIAREIVRILSESEVAKKYAAGSVCWEEYFEKLAGGDVA